MTPEPFNHGLTTTTTTRAWNDDQDGGGGGGERTDDVEDGEGNLPEDNHASEAETANLQRDLADALAALGVRPEMARRAVDAGTVTSDQHVILCKRFLQSSTANAPAAVLWSQYLSLGRLPPAPYSESSTVTADQLAAARRMMQESDRRAQIPDEIVGLKGLSAMLSGNVLRPVAPPARTSGQHREPLRFPANPRL